jgi:Flp pilus assembly protein TadG
MSFAARIKGFLRHQSGNVAIMFGLSSFGIAAMAGVAMDYSSASNARTALAAAADAAALAGATTRGTASAREVVARATFETNLQRSPIDGSYLPTYRAIEENGRIVGYSVGVSGSISSRFGAFYGRTTVDVDLLAEARAGGSGPVDIALVLDTTASMQGARIDGLKSAVNMLLDEIGASDLATGSVRLGVVPFAQYVNVGMSNRNAPWISVPADYQVPVTNTCALGYAQTGETNCRDVYVPPYSCTNDGVTSTCPGYTYRQCDPVYSSTQTNICTSSGGNWVRWYGCVGARPSPLNLQDANYSTRIPGLMDTWCATPVQPLTMDVSSVRATVNGLTTYGDTYLPAGLVWGWRLLSAGEPFAVALNGGQPTKKFMILVTDGRNTRSVDGQWHSGTNGAQSNIETRSVCQNIAADTTTGTQVFTIAFEMDGLDTKTILQECATRTKGAFYDARDVAALRSALSDTLRSIIKVSLTR